MQKKTSDAQLKATKRWRESNKDKAKYNSYKSSAKTFIRNHATLKDIKELREMLKEKEKQVNQG